MLVFRTLAFIFCALAMSLDDAAWVLKEFGYGPVRLPLWSVGPATFNRGGLPLSGKHIHAMARRIGFVEGMQKHMYNFGFCHEPNPNDKQEVARHYAEMALKDRLLPPCRETMQHGSFGKSHLSNMLQAFDAHVAFDDDGLPMQVPPGQKALQEHVEHGMFWMVLRWEAVEKHKDMLVALMRSLNSEPWRTVDFIFRAFIFGLGFLDRSVNSLAFGLPVLQPRTSTAV
jgi:hypothetical protein